jgi:CBS domain-containing protein
MTDFTSLSPRQRRRGSMSGSFSGSASLGNSFILGPAVTDEMDSWLDVTAEEVLKTAETETPRVTGDTGLEKATEILIKSEASCLLVETGGGFGLFDFSDLNTVLLLVLVSASQDVTEDVFDERSRELINYFKRGIRFGIGAVCDISQKNPSHSFPPSTPLRRLLPLFASGIHRVVISGETPQILTSTALLAHLTRKPPPIFRMPLSEVDLPLHQLVSLPQTATVLDAMQVLSLNGLSALGVTTGDPDREGELSSLVGVVTTSDCARVVVPSEGKLALEMSLADMCKGVLSEYPGGDLGEERVPGKFLSSS